ncbi:ABC transporter substrate-binding protein [Micromonospora sp. NPDC049559]|uniref:ABC transporter substrate-binding protein n=1 Tax=Micromonospora sp. NPDC049559 TaxID=3155923 RepID=UPI00341D3944
MSLPAPGPAQPPGTARRVPSRPTRRGVVAGMLSLLALPTLAGCDDEASAPRSGKIELSVFWWGAQRRAALTEQALQLYSQHHPEVTFRVTWQGNAGYYDRVATEAAGGNPPDLFQIDDNYLSEYAQRRIILDLTDFVERKQLDLSGLPNSLAQYGQLGGRTMAVAGAENTPGLIFNRSLLRRLDLPEPRIGMSYEEYLDWAVSVTERSDGKVAGTMDPSADYKALWLWLRSRGLELYRGRQMGFTEPDLIAWFDLWKQARARRATPSVAVIQQADGGDVTQQLVATGKAAASFMWSNQLSELQKNTNDELDVVSYPGDPRAQWARASMYWAAFRGTRHPEAVVDVINFLTNNLDAGRILGTERGLSANLGVRQAVEASLTDKGMKRTSAFEAEMTNRFGSAPVPPPKGHAKVRALLQGAAEGVQSGRQTSRAAAIRFIGEANAALTS